MLLAPLNIKLMAVFISRKVVYWACNLNFKVNLLRAAQLCGGGGGDFCNFKTRLCKNYVTCSPIVHPEKLKDENKFKACSYFFHLYIILVQLDAYRTKNRFAVTRHLLSSVEWEKCDFEIGHKRNYSDPNSWHSNGDAKLWVALYIVLVLIVFVGK